MSLQVFSTNETPPSSKMNALSRQTVIRCTSSTRPAGPDEGMQIFEEDSDLHFYWTGSAWRSHPKGTMVNQRGTGTGIGGFIGTTPTLVNNSECIFVNVTNEIYRYSWDFAITAVAGGISTINNVYTVRPRVESVNLAGEQRDIHVHFSEVITPVAGFVDVSWVSENYRDFEIHVFRGVGSTPLEVPVGGRFAVEHLGTGPAG